MSDKLWLEPNYFSKFSCKCGDCRHTCCSTWRIAVSEKEYYNMIGLDCSEKLHNELESSFGIPDFPTKECFRYIEPDWQGNCRMLREDGLCRLQRECGAEALSEVCRVYPRSFREENGRLISCCSTSCERVVELLLEEESFLLSLRNEHAHADMHEALANDFEKLNRLSLETIKDRSLPLRERIAKICTYFDYDINAETKKALPYLLNILEELDTECPSLQPFFETVKEAYSGTDSVKALLLGEKEFEEAYPDWSRYFENCICNNLVYSAFPYADSRISPKEACAGLALQYAVIRIICAAHTTNNKSKEDLVDAIATCYHLIEHTPFYYNAHVLVENPLSLLWV